MLRDICGVHVIVGEGLQTINFGKMISLNETAALLWQKAAEMGEFSTESLADALCEEYEVSNEQALADTERIVADWKQNGIVEE